MCGHWKYSHEKAPFPVGVFPLVTTVLWSAPCFELQNVNKRMNWREPWPNGAWDMHILWESGLHVSKVVTAFEIFVGFLSRLPLSQGNGAGHPSKGQATKRNAMNAIAAVGRATPTPSPAPEVVRPGAPHTQFGALSQAAGGLCVAPLCSCPFDMLCACT